MTVENRALLEAIRIIVGEAVAPLTTRVGGLTDRVDVLTDRVDGLSERVDGQTVRMDGLFEHVGGLTVQMDVVIERTDRIEAEQRAQRGLLEGMDLRLATLEGISRRLEGEIETIETRTAQMSSDVRDLLDQQDKMNKVLRTLRREVEYAIVQIEAIQDIQPGYQQQLRQLNERVDSLERRLAKLESPEDTR